MLAAIKRRLASVPAMQYRQSFALNDLDKKLEAFVGKKRGVYLEAGGYDGLRQSNTKYYEKYFGWKGILVEPVPELYRACVKNRPHAYNVNAALVGDSRAQPTVELTYCGLMTTTDGAMKTDQARDLHIKNGVQFLAPDEKPYKLSAKGMQLSEIIDESPYDEIDLLSLDVEGAEIEALTGLDLTRHSPHHILVEIRQQNRNLINDILTATHKEVATLTVSDSYCDVLFARHTK
ncbi:MAG: FkbM family methyltransferase [Planctomycetaceae bacterium]|nr:FkbM family methyltransferase [Planctomycetaceae bacterium]